MAPARRPRSPGAQAARLLAALDGDSGDRLSAYNLSVYLGRCVFWSQLVVLAGGIAGFITFAVGLDDRPRRFVFAFIALFVLGIVGAFFAPIAQSRRLGQAIRFARRRDTALFALAVMLVITLTCVAVQPVVPEAVQAILLLLLLGLHPIIVIFGWASFLNQREERRRLTR